MESDQPHELKRGRGRPRKPVSEKTQSEMENKQPPVKRKVGRPRKHGVPIQLQHHVRQYNSGSLLSPAKKRKSPVNIEVSRDNLLLKLGNTPQVYNLEEQDLNVEQLCETTEKLDKTDLPQNTTNNNSISELVKDSEDSNDNRLVIVTESDASLVGDVTKTGGNCSSHISPQFIQHGSNFTLNQTSKPINNYSGITISCDSDDNSNSSLNITNFDPSNFLTATVEIIEKPSEQQPHTRPGIIISDSDEEARAVSSPLAYFEKRFPILDRPFAEVTKNRTEKPLIELCGNTSLSESSAILVIDSEDDTRNSDEVFEDSVQSLLNYLSNRDKYKENPLSADMSFNYTESTTVTNKPRINGIRQTRVSLSSSTNIDTGDDSNDISDFVANKNSDSALYNKKTLNSYVVLYENDEELQIVGCPNHKITTQSDTSSDFDDELFERLLPTNKRGRSPSPISVAQSNQDSVDNSLESMSNHESFNEDSTNEELQIQKKIKLDKFSETYSSAVGERDLLTGKGVMDSIENINVVEFETLNDMVMYDNIASEMGVHCYASFKPYTSSFPGFTPEETVDNHLNRFSSVVDKMLPNVNSMVGSTQNSELSNRFSQTANKMLSSFFGRDSDLLTPITSPAFASTSGQYHSSSSLDSYAGLALTPSASPLSSPSKCNEPRGLVYRLHNQIPPIYRNLKTNTSIPSQYNKSGFGKSTHQFGPKSSSANLLELTQTLNIPFIYKCNNREICQSPTTCAMDCKNFILYLRITVGYGRPLSKSATKCVYLSDENTLVSESLAIIAASAVKSPTTTIFIPVTEDISSNLLSEELPQNNKNCVSSTKSLKVKSPERNLQKNRDLDLPPQSKPRNHHNSRSSLNGSSSEATVEVPHIRSTLPVIDLCSTNEPSGALLTPAKEKECAVVNAVNLRSSDHIQSPKPARIQRKTAASIPTIDLCCQEDFPESPVSDEEPDNCSQMPVDSNQSTEVVGVTKEKTQLSINSSSDEQPKRVIRSSGRSSGGEMDSPTNSKCVVVSNCDSLPIVMNVLNQSYDSLVDSNTDPAQSAGLTNATSNAQSKNDSDKTAKTPKMFMVIKLSKSDNPRSNEVSVSNSNTASPIKAVTPDTSTVPIIDLSASCDTPASSNLPNCSPSRTTEEPEICSIPPANNSPEYHSEDDDVIWQPDVTKECSTVVDLTLDDDEEPNEEASFPTSLLPDTSSFTKSSKTFFITSPQIPKLGYFQVYRLNIEQHILLTDFTIFKRAFVFTGMLELSAFLNSRLEPNLTFIDETILPLKWDLVTLGVLSVKKIPPFRPDIWWTPDNYIVTESRDVVTREVYDRDYMRKQVRPRSPKVISRSPAAYLVKTPTNDVISTLFTSRP